MFSEEPEQSESTDQRQKRLAREGRDRKSLFQVLTAFASIFGGFLSLIAVDVVGVERRLTNATVVGFSEKWYRQGAHECVTQLLTGFGDAQIYTRNQCRYAPWRIGDTAEVKARMLRFTKTVVIDTKGTIFGKAYSYLPQF